MSGELVVQSNGGALAKASGIVSADLERVLIAGDLSKLTSDQRIEYYGAVCKSLGLNPLTKPFEYLDLDGKLTLYVKKDCTDQLRTIHNISVKLGDARIVEGVYVQKAFASTPSGRTDESSGAVPVVKEEGQWKTAQSGKKYFEGTGRYLPIPPEAKANAIMKAETKAKRRATLSICGLGFLDESELDTIPSARRVSIDEPRLLTEAREDSQDTTHRAEETAGYGDSAEERNSDRPPARGTSQTSGSSAGTAPSAATTDKQSRPSGEVPDEVQALWRRMGNIKGVVEVCDEMKFSFSEMIGPAGESEYYRILEKHGVQHSNQFKAMEKARLCVKDLWLNLKAAEALSAEPEPANV